MNTMKEKHVPQRNITPNFIRFKSNPHLTQGRTAMENPSPPKTQPATMQRTPSAVPLRSVVAVFKFMKNVSSISANSVCKMLLRG